MKGRSMIMRRIAPAAVLWAAVLWAGASPASTWCGGNGLVRFSFAEGDSLVSVLHTAAAENGVTAFDVYAWLTDVESVARDGEAFLHLGGFELNLSIDGAEAFILAQEFPSKALNVGQEMGQIAVGMYPGEKIKDGKVFLVHWKVMIQGRPEDLRIGLAPGLPKSCSGLEGCEESEPPALYVGNEGSRQMGAIFGAGYVPSWVNPTGEPDQTPVRVKHSWRDVGVFKER